MSGLFDGVGKEEKQALGIATEIERAAEARNREERLILEAFRGLSSAARHITVSTFLAAFRQLKLTPEEERLIIADGRGVLLSCKSLLEFHANRAQPESLDE